MARKLFGTDGVRGVANQQLTPELALSLGRAAGQWLHNCGAVKRAVVGRDTRQSGTMLESALAAGLASAGVSVVSVGIAPTPAIAFVARTQDFGLGCIVSASHNPAPDNGIKFVGHNGEKLSDETEEAIEREMATPAERTTGGDVGHIETNLDLLQAYENFLVELLPSGLRGLRVAVDAAHGAAYEIAPRVLRRLGAMVEVMGVTPDGVNINAEGGATKPQTIQTFTVQSGASVGVAFDGDADRAIFSDETGRLINGDRMVGAWAAQRQEQGTMVPPVVVGTLMSNGGFADFLHSRGIRLERAPVGDKYVAAKIQETHALIGGEQSGHIIIPKFGPTGDGLVTMLEFLRVMTQQGRTASSYLDDYEPWPQLLVNVAVNDISKWKETLVNDLTAVEKELEGIGRVVVRASGTQPMIRVMVEASTYQARDAAAARLVNKLISQLGGRVEGRVDLTHALGD